MEGTDNKPTKTKKESFNERLRAKYPEQNLDQEEDFFGRVNDDYDDYENRIAEYKKHEGELSDMFTADPRSASFLTNWREGKDPLVELVRQFGPDFQEALNDPSKVDALAEANKEFLERVSKAKELEELYKTNLAESLQNLETMQSDQGLTDEQIDAATDLLQTICNDFIVGKFTPDTIQMMLNAMNHDVDVARASEDGEVRGRNTRIDEKLRKKKGGDGTPSLAGKNGGAPSTRPRRSLGALDKFDDNSLSIWERGGEKRHKA